SDENFRGVSVDLQGVEVAEAMATEAGKTALPPAGIHVSKTIIKTDEKGKRAKFRVRLTSPLDDGDVFVKISSSKPKEAVVWPASLHFTAGNWEKWQKVTVRGMNDNDVDYDQPYKINLVVDDEKTGAVRYHGKTATVFGTNINVDRKVDLSVAPADLCDPTTTSSVVLTARLRGADPDSGGVSLTFEKSTIETKFDNAGYTVSDFPEEITIPAGNASASTTFTITVDAVSGRESFDISGELQAPGRVSASKYNTIGVVPTKLTVRKFDLDVDGSGAINAWDGIMTMRYLIGVRDERLTAGQSNARYNDVVKCFPDDLTEFDVDGNLESDENDGALIARYLFGLRGEDLFEGLVIPEEKKPEVKKNLTDLCPGCKPLKPLCPDCEE
ncbi:MAG: hypothetical protein MPK75_09345, partial [Alphaproteobacteria bacterium]|nr:hypothetical protein [Alphaproteobacteria bacterium]